AQERNIMEKTRTHLALIAMVASMSLLAACSKGEDATPPADGAPGAEAPAPAPMPAPEPAPAPAPAPEPTPGTSPSDAPTPAPSSSEGSTIKESAKQAANTISDKAVELKDSAARKAGDMGDAIKAGAAKADKAIQDSVGNPQVSGTTAAAPSEQAKP